MAKTLTIADCEVLLHVVDVATSAANFDLNYQDEINIATDKLRDRIKLLKVKESKRVVKHTVYKAYAFNEDYQEKRQANEETYKQIKSLAVVQHIGNGHANARYRVVENKHNLSDDELALICDSGNLCFGYRREGNNIIIYID